MSCETDTHEGGCFCGAVRYRVDGPIGSVAHCHCNSCRRSSGAAFVTWFTVDRDRFVRVAGAPMQYHSSPGVTREFCGRCGTELTYANDKAARTIDVTLGSLDCSAGHPADRHVWVSDKLDWLHVDDHLPAYQGWSTDG